MGIGEYGNEDWRLSSQANAHSVPAHTTFVLYCRQLLRCRSARILLGTRATCIAKTAVSKLLAAARRRGLSDGSPSHS